MASLQEKIALLKTQVEQQKAEKEKEELERLLAEAKQRNADEKVKQQDQERVQNLEKLISLEAQLLNTEQTLNALTIKSAEFTILDYIHSNKEVFEPLGVSDLKTFINHPEFQDVEEVDTYQRLLEKTPELVYNDQILLKKIASASGGHYTELDKDTISRARKSIQKIKLVAEKQILKTKLEIPEKRQEVIEAEAVKLEKNLPTPQLLDLDTVAFGNGMGAPSLVQKGGSIQFRDWWKADLVPKEYESLQDMYGEEVAQEILSTAYEQKIHNAILEYDKKNENYSEFEKILAENNSEALLDAKEAFRVFNDTVYEAQNVLKQKSEELLSKGISFDPRFIPVYRGTYDENILSLDAMSESIQSSLYDKSRDHPFPPKYPYKDVQKLIQQRVVDIQEFIEVITSIQNQEDIDSFGKSTNGASKEKTAQYFHEKQMNARLDKKPPFQGFSSITEKVQSLFDLEKHVENKKKLYSKKEHGFVITMEKAIEAQRLLPEIKKEMKQILGYDINPLDWESRIKRIEESAERAQGELYSLTIFEQSLKGDSYRLSGNFLYDTVIEEDVKTKIKERDVLEDQKKLIEQEERWYPKKLSWLERVTGIDPNEGLQEVQKRYAEVVKKIEEKQNEINSLSRSAATPILPNSGFRDGFRELSAPKGNAGEALAPIRAYLQEKIKTNITPELVKKIDVYTNLVKELQ